MAVPTIALQDILYDKTYVCPVCDKTFYTKAIKLRKNQVISTDLDLYSHYSMVNPILYDCILCPKCGYASISHTFDKLLSTQKQWIKEQICANYKPQYFNEYATLSQSIVKHKMALLTSIIKKGKIGEQAYIALHIAWLYRDLKDLENEKIFLKRALDGFKKATETESFPIINLDEQTAYYIIAAIAYLTEEFATAKQYISAILTNSGSNPKIKDRALDLKEKLKDFNSI